MNKLLIPLMCVPLIVGAEINQDYNFSVSFPTKADAPTQQEMNLLVACCKNNASCCVDFSKSTNLEDFKNKVKAIDRYQSAMRDGFISRSKEIANHTMEIKARINNSQMRYQQRFDSIGNEDYRK
jgi:hypothetical protein